LPADLVYGDVVALFAKCDDAGKVGEISASSAIIGFSKMTTYSLTADVPNG
jgi:hypothetical protein